jgi:membrane-bound lytic murein transglycosylase A
VLQVIEILELPKLLNRQSFVSQELESSEDYFSLVLEERLTLQSCAMSKVHRYLIVAIIPLLLFSCYPFIKRDVREPAKALKKVKYFWPEFRDDTDIDSLDMAIDRSLQYYDRLGEDAILSFGPDVFPVSHIKQSMRTFQHLIRQNPDIKALNRELRTQFILYKSVGSRRDGKVLFTGYYEPILEGGLVCDPQHPYPIYQRPDDLLSIDLGLFRPQYRGERVMARLDGRRLIPYYTREEIVNGKTLEGRDLEIAWLRDSLDLAILHIHGSGMVRLPNGDTIRVGYNASNGHPYRSIGRYMIDKGYIEDENLSLQTIRSFLKEHPDIKEEILNVNPSYIFFQMLDDEGPLGNIGVPLTPGRSLALDDRLFPKGALLYIRCQKPIIGEDGKILEWVPFSRFLLNQDTGGVIKGTGRADIFWGSDPYAELAAGHLKHSGEIYFLVQKPDH